MVVLGAEEGKWSGQGTGADAGHQLELGAVSSLGPAHQQTGAKGPTCPATRDRQEIYLLSKPGGPILTGFFAGLGKEGVGKVGHLVTPDTGTLDTRHQAEFASSVGRGFRFGTDVQLATRSIRSPSVKRRFP